MAERAELVGALHQHLPDLVRDDDAGQRRVGRGQALGDGDQVGLDAVVVGAEHRAEPAEAGDDLVGDQQHVVFLQHRLDLLPVAGRRRHDAAGAEDRLADEGGDRVRPLGQDHLLELVGAVLRELLLAHRAVGAAEIIGRLGVQDRRARQVEGVVEEVEAGQRAGHDARAVIAAPARDDLLLLGPAEHVVVVPDQLDVGLVGVGAGQAEIDAATCLSARGR